MPVALCATLTMSLVACSDDDDSNPNPNPNPNPGTETTVKVDPKTVFPEGAPSQVGDLLITTNEDGLVSQIVDGDEVTTFNYEGSSATKSSDIKIPTEYDMTMNVKWGNDPDGVDFYITLNEQGYIAYAYEVDEDSDFGDTAEEWWFKYNDKGQLIEMKRTEGDNEITTISYNADGDITSVKTADDDDPAGKYECTVSYPDKIVNKSGIMLYDDVFDIDMDEMAPAYYAGLLGKATTHLPQEAVEKNLRQGEGEYDWSYEYKFTWTLDGSQMPVKLECFEKYSDGYHLTDEIPLKW